MKEKELRNAAICANCNKPFGHSQLPLFYRITIQQFAIELEAIQRQDGLAALLGGNSALAHVIGPNEDMAKPISEAKTITLCETCALEPIIIGLLAESENDEK